LVLKNTDWSRTPVFNQYQKNNGRFKAEKSIYSEVELKYLYSSLSSMITTHNDDEFNESEGKAILAKHEQKLFHTL